MLGFRLSSPGPFWFEDLVYFVIDESRRLPGRAAGAAARIHRMAEATGRSAVATFRNLALPAEQAAPVLRTPVRQEADPLDGPLTWTLATEPLTAAGTGASTAAALHKAAAEQLGALTYALDRLRDELVPVMREARLGRGEVHRLGDAARLETSVEALLALSRRNAATRPKYKTLNAA